MKTENRASNFWFGFFIGGLVGAFIIFLLGTKEGKKLAEKIEEKAEFFEEDIEKKVGKLQKQGEDLLQNAQDMKDRVAKEIVDKKASASDALVSKMDKTLSKIVDIQKKGMSLTEEVHSKYFKKNGKTLTS